MEKAEARIVPMPVVVDMGYRARPGQSLLMMCHNMWAAIAVDQDQRIANRLLLPLLAFYVFGRYAPDQRTASLSLVCEAQRIRSVSPAADAFVYACSP